jgi:hypothetical protein
MFSVYYEEHILWQPLDKANTVTNTPQQKSQTKAKNAVSHRT